VSESELRSAAHACVETLTRRGRVHLARRVGAQLDVLIGRGQRAHALAVIALFER
jgi:hypothetical protein